MRLYWDTSEPKEPTWVVENCDGAAPVYGPEGRDVKPLLDGLAAATMETLDFYEIRYGASPREVRQACRRALKEEGKRDR